MTQISDQTSFKFMTNTVPMLSLFRTLVLIFFVFSIAAYSTISNSKDTEVAQGEDTWDDYYTFKSITIPPEVNAQIGGLTVLKNGNIAAAFHRGEVLIYDPNEDKWQTFAHGLHEPLGLHELADGSLILAQMAELTRLVDEDKNGQADFYQTISDDFGLSGNYHEFAFGPAVDSKGNYYISLNVASNFAGIFENIRGTFSPFGPSRDTMTDWRNDEWKNTLRHTAGRMFSKVPYRGWVLKITPEGKASPFASGFRSPNGLYVDKNDKLWVTDNQGDWLGTSPLYHVQEGKFYGHPASLVWNKGWDRDPLDVSAHSLNQMRTPPAGLFPHGELANSPTQAIAPPQNKLFGLPTDELIIGDMNQQRLIRFLPDQVNGVMQGAAIPFLETAQLGIGNNRFAFDLSGNLWIGKTHLGWAGDEGIKSVAWNKKPYLFVSDVTLTKNGFKISFSLPLDTKPSIAAEAHTYHYHAKYGSPKVDHSANIKVNTTLSEDRKTMWINYPQLASGYVYTMNLRGAQTQDSQALLGNIIRYTVNQIPQSD
ncbi:hypothetical protein [Agaribacter flavus]|uniref:Glucose/Sorbosone dehydrogenase domain-containing protein n=1 Tax=Agaribacter flavus TaxID=1902781 RepID=A0ABV7FM43_9ALTE